MRPEPLEDERVPKQESHRRFLIRMGKYFVLLYLIFVAILASVNLFSPVRVLPWAEVFYGPAITIVCCFALFAAATCLGSRRGGPES